MLTEVSAVPEYEAGGHCTGRDQFQVAVVSPGKARSRAAARLVMASLDNAPLAFEDGPLLYLRHADFVSSKDPEKGPGGVDVWRTVVTFSAITAESI